MLEHPLVVLHHAEDFLAFEDIPFIFDEFGRINYLINGESLNKKFKNSIF